MRSRTLPPSDGDPEASALGPGRGRRHRGGGPPKYYAIKTVAEALDVSRRTVTRWIASGDLVVFRADGVVRIAESDLKAFLAMHREG
jgi:excisionase family DNA binding protein